MSAPTNSPWIRPSDLLGHTPITASLKYRRSPVSSDTTCRANRERAKPRLQPGWRDVRDSSRVSRRPSDYSCRTTQVMKSCVRSSLMEVTLLWGKTHREVEQIFIFVYILCQRHDRKTCWNEAGLCAVMVWGCSSRVEASLWLRSTSGEEAIARSQCSSLSGDKRKTQRLKVRLHYPWSYLHAERPI